VADCVNHLKALRVPAEKIKVENFPGY